MGYSYLHKVQQKNDGKILLNICAIHGCKSLAEMLDVVMKVTFKGVVFEKFQWHIGDHF